MIRALTGEGPCAGGEGEKRRRSGGRSSARRPEGPGQRRGRPAAQPVAGPPDPRPATRRRTLQSSGRPGFRLSPGPEFRRRNPRPVGSAAAVGSGPGPERPRLVHRRIRHQPALSRRHLRTHPDRSGSQRSQFEGPTGPPAPRAASEPLRPVAVRALGCTRNWS